MKNNNSNTKLSCAVFNPGQVSYEEGLALQEEARILVDSGKWDGVLLLLEHNPVITIGKSGGLENLLLNQSSLAEKGIDLVHTQRGGNITCHNPGQIVGYPILNLKRWNPDIHWYVYTLEEAIIKTLSRVGLDGERNEHTGVWIKNSKIAAIGIFIKKWITCHGFALNAVNDLSLFSLIVPCGLKEFGVTSIEKLNGCCNLESLYEMLIQDFGESFNCNMIKVQKLGGGHKLGTPTLA